MFNTMGNKLARSIDANADILMGGGALFGLGTTVFLAIKETPNAIEILNDAADKMEAIRKRGLSEELEDALLLDIRIRCLGNLILNYGPAEISALATGTCIVGIVGTGRSRSAALSGMLNASNLMYQEYKDHTIEVVGKKKEMEIEDRIREEHIAKSPITSNVDIYNTGVGNTLCRLELEPGVPETGFYFWSDPEYIRQVEDDIIATQDDFQTISMADVLFFLKIKERPRHCAHKGWPVNSKFRFLYSSHLQPNTNIPVLDISYLVNPVWI